MARKESGKLFNKLWNKKFSEEGEYKMNPAMHEYAPGVPEPEFQNLKRMFEESGNSVKIEFDEFDKASQSVKDALHTLYQEGVISPTSETMPTDWNRQE